MSDPVVPHGKMRRQSLTQVGIAEPAALARNPNDIRCMRLGEALLAANDPHLARLALAQRFKAEARGPNLYGVACARAGDYEAASGLVKQRSRVSARGLRTQTALATQLGVPNIKQLTGPVWVVTNREVSSGKLSYLISLLSICCLFIACGQQVKSISAADNRLPSEAEKSLMLRMRC